MWCQFYFHFLLVHWNFDTEKLCETFETSIFYVFISYMILNSKLLQCVHCIWIGGYKWLLLKVILSSTCEECNFNTHSKLISVHRIWLNYCWTWLLILNCLLFFGFYIFTSVSVLMVVFFAFCYFHKKISHLQQYYVFKIQKCS